LKKVLGIDIGGTKTSMGIIDIHSGKIYKKLELLSKTFNDDKKNLSNIISRSIELIENFNIKEIGIGVPELINNKGIIRDSYNFNWDNLNLRNFYPKSYNIKIDSDVRNHLRAEKYFGYGKSHKNFIYINIGSGISYALMIDNKIYNGANGFAISFTSSKITLFNPNTNKTTSLIPEDLYSGKSIIHYLSKLRSDSQKDIYLKKISNSLSSIIGNLINTVDPGMVVLGGGVVTHNKQFRKILIDKTRDYILSSDVKKIKFNISKLKKDTGLIGSALLFR
jgi:glucokinase|tara:strand:+ start:9818 stop:10654 length:837 start_codon:yes stop_codon:yes gene_type:complete